MSTSLVPATVSTQIGIAGQEMRQKQPATQPQLYWNMPTLLTSPLECTCSNFSVGVTVKLRMQSKQTKVTQSVCDLIFEKEHIPAN